MAIFALTSSVALLADLRGRPDSTPSSRAFTSGDGPPGIASVSDTVLAAWGSPLAEGNDGFHSG
jgi:hypothetical protein